MSSEIDQRVVQMKFDNAQFESGVDESLNSIEKLKKSLNFSGCEKGLQEVSKAAGNVNLDGLSKDVDNIASRFSNFGIIGTTVLMNLTNRAIDMAAAITKSLSIDQIIDGYGEYEMKMNSIKTIMSGSGESLENVKDALEELNVYADKTIYSFKDMTSNVGKFTNAGVKLETATAAMQGISNWAALSGSTTDQASHAMYNLSQALSAGYVALVDWKSVGNIAQMGTLRAKEAFVETAVALGTLKRESVEAAGNVNKFFGSDKDYGLQKKWLTNDVLMQTLKAFSVDTAAMSEAELEAYKSYLTSMGYTAEMTEKLVKIGAEANEAATQVRTFKQLADTIKESIGSAWGASFELIFGDLDEATKLWTSVNTVIDAFTSKISKSRIATLQFWHDQGGRTELFQGLLNVIADIARIIMPIKQGFSEMFPRNMGETLTELSYRFRAFTERMYLSDDAAEGLKQTVKLLLVPLKIFTNLIHALTPYVKFAAGSIGGLANSFLEFMAAAKPAEKTFEILSEKAKELFSSTEGIGKPFGEAAELFKKSNNIIEASSAGIATIVKTLGGIIAESFRNGTAQIAIFTTAVGGLASILLGGFAGATAGVIRTFWKISEIFDGFGDMLEAFQAKKWDLYANAILKMAGAIAILSVGVKLLSTIDVNSLWNSVGAISALAGVLLLTAVAFKALFSGFEKVDGFWGKIGDAFADMGKVAAFNGYADALIKISGALAILAASLKLISTIDPKYLWSYVEAFAALAAIMTAFTFALTKMVKSIDITWGSLEGHFSGIKNLISGFQQVIAVDVLGSAVMKMAASLYIAAAALKTIAEIPSNKLDEVGLALAGLAAGLVVMMYALNKITGNKAMKIIKSKNITSTLIGMAASIYILAQAVKVLGGLDTDSIIQGSIAVAGLMVSLGLVAGLLGNFAPKLSKGAGIFIAMAVAVDMLAVAFVHLGAMDFESIGRSLVAVGGMMLELVASALLLSLLAPKMAKGSLILIGLALSVDMLCIAIKSLGNMGYSEIAQGLIGIGVALALLGGTTIAITRLAGSAGKMIAAGAAMMLMATACLVFAVGLNALANVPIESLGVALGVLAGSLVMLGTVMVIIGHFALQALAGSAAMLIMSGAIGILAVALGAFNSISGDAIKSLMIVVGALSLLAVVLGTIAVVVIPGAAVLGILALAMLGIAAAVYIFSAATNLAARAFETFSSALGGFADSLNNFGAVSDQAIENFKGLILPISALIVVLGIFGPAASIGATGLYILSAAFEKFSTALINALPALEGLQNIELVKIAGGLALFGAAGLVAGPAGVSMGLGAPGVISFARSLIILAEAICLLKKALAGEDILEAAKEAGSSIGAEYAIGVADSVETVEVVSKEVGAAAPVSFANGVGLNIGDVNDSGENIVQTFVSSLFDSNMLNSSYVAGSAYGNSFNDGAKDALASGGIWENYGLKAKDAAKDTDTLSAAAAKNEQVMARNGKTVDNTADSFFNEDTAISKLLKDYGLVNDETVELGNGFDAAADSATGFGNAAEDSGKKASKAAKDTGKALDYMSNKMTHDPKVILNNMASQIRTTMEWATTLSDLKKRGLSDGLMSYLKEKGASNISEVKAFAKMSAEEMQMANQLFAKGLAKDKVAEGIIEGKYGEEGYNAAKSFVNGFQMGQEELNSKMNEIKTQLDKFQNGGNVNLSMRPFVDTSELEKYGWKPGEGIATVFSSTFSNEDGSVAINFTPILADDKGNHIGTLTPDELEDYAMGVINGTREDDLHIQIGAAFEGDDAIDQAEKAAMAIHDLHDQVLDLKDAAHGSFVVLDEELRSSIESAIDNFAKFDKATDLSKKEVLDNMQSQIDGITEWSNMIRELGAKGVDEGLLQHLAEMGPSGYKYVHAFSEMTAEELARANDLWMQQMQLDEAATGTIMEGYRKAGEWSSAGFVNGINQEAANKVMENLGNNALWSLRDVLEMSSENSESEKMADVGMYACLGVAKGIEENKSVAIDAAVQMAAEAYAEACKELDIRSPSRKFEDVGMYSAMGMAKGIVKNGSRVTSSVKDLARDTIDLMRGAMDAVFSILDTDEDFNPTITPILDLSEIQNSRNNLDSIFNGTRMTAMLAGNINAGFNRGTATTQSTDQIVASVANKCFDKMSEAISNLESTTNVNVTLEGDTSKIFRAVRNENSRIIKSTGYNPLNPQ